MKTIYCDLDGVLADYNSEKERLIGIIRRDGESYIENRDYKKIVQHLDYSTLNVLPRGVALLKALHKLKDSYRFKLKLLGSTGGPQWHRKARNQKLLWLERNGLKEQFDKIIFVPGWKLKEKFSNKNSLLIDDSQRNIEIFKKSNGSGILYSEDGTLEHIIGYVKEFLEK